MSLLSKIVGNTNERVLKKMQPAISAINALEKELERLQGEELKNRTNFLKKRIQEGGDLDSILSEAFALVRESAKRTLSQRHYDVQLIGGIVLHQGKIAEMKTGEGKTLAATLPVYLNALLGKGVHVVTVNDYLSKRDAVWMGQIYNLLGLSVGVIAHDSAYLYDESHTNHEKHNSQHGINENDPKKLQATSYKLDQKRDELGSFKVEEEFLRPCSRKEAYSADITYGTNNEFGFDYLRDNLAPTMEEKVQRKHYFAIVDEIDSILIDEARTPLIISAPDQESSELYTRFARIVPIFKEDTDYNVDYKMRAVSIMEGGIDKVEKALGVKNIYDPTEGGGIRYVHNLEQALKAQVLYTRDKDYVVKDGEVIIVDEFTGRLMLGRRYSEGLHQAIEAKEGVRVKEESRTLASITFQNYFRMYEKLAGMTGTALTSAEEFDRVYKLDIVEVPTDKPLIREGMPDLIFRTEKGKFQALLQDIKERNKSGQPVLIGTTSIEKNEYLSRLLTKEGVEHKLLNAKNHEAEAQIIAQAGKLGAVTVATNMAGRGVDIMLGGHAPSKLKIKSEKLKIDDNGTDLNFEYIKWEEEHKKVLELGGLHIIGTERHEARRIDNQLRGRSGRQGDPGSSQFYLSLEDEILRIFGGDRVQKLMSTLNLPEDQPIQSKLVSNAIESAQSRIEGMNFDARKHLLEYDEVLNKHRETIYKKRDKILAAKIGELEEMLKGYLESFIHNLAFTHLAADYKEEWNVEELFENIRALHNFGKELHSELESKVKTSDVHPHVLREDIKKFILEKLQVVYEEKKEKLGEENFANLIRWVLLRSIDILWMDHLDAMVHMRDSVGLRAYAQRDPLVEYKNEGIGMFKALLSSIEITSLNSFFKAEIRVNHTNEDGISRGRTVSDSLQDNRKLQASNKIGRNDPCPCGAINPATGQIYKYKKCGMINAPYHKK